MSNAFQDAFEDELEKLAAGAEKTKQHTNPGPRITALRPKFPGDTPRVRVDMTPMQEDIDRVLTHMMAGKSVDDKSTTPESAAWLNENWRKRYPNSAPLYHPDGRHHDGRAPTGHK